MPAEFRKKVISSRQPTSATIITAPAIATGSGTKCASVTATIPPSITNSPCAKFRTPVAL
jgi:hypothetical protein